MSAIYKPLDVYLNECVNDWMDGWMERDSVRNNYPTKVIHDHNGQILAYNKRNIEKNKHF